MKIELSLKQFNEALAIVSRAVAVRPQLPVLSNVLLEALPSGVKLSATDLELGISLFIPGKVDEVGKVTVPSKMLLDYVSSVAGEKIALSLNGDKLLVAASSSQATIQTIPAEEFPQMAQMPDEGIKIGAESLASALDRVIFAAAKDSLRPVLTGILFEVEKKKLRVVATDGFRLALNDVSIDGSWDEKKTFIIPARASLEIAKMAKEGDIEFVYVEETKQVAFRAGKMTLVSQVMEGNFPDYTRILPKSFQISFNVSREELLQAVRSVAIFARDNSNVMRWNISEGELVATGEAQEKGQGKASCAVEILEGDEINVVFNAKYVLDFLGASSKSSVKISLGANLAPGSFQEDSNENYLYVVMPINA